MRLKRQIDETNGKQIVKTYHYVKHFVPGSVTDTSSGILGQPYLYIWPNFTWTDDDGRPVSFSLGGFTNLLNTWSNDPAVGYSEVVEETKAGFKRYIFTNFDGDYFGEKHLDIPPDRTNYTGISPYLPCSSRDVERGKLSCEEFYNKEWKLVYRKTISYLREESKYTPFIWRESKAVGAKGEMITLVATYKKFHYRYNPKTITEYYYNEGTYSPQIQKTNIFYNTLNSLPSRIETTQSDSSEYIKSFTYSSDIHTDGYEPLLNQLKVSKNECISIANKVLIDCRKGCFGDGADQVSECNDACQTELTEALIDCDMNFIAQKRELDATDVSLFKTMRDSNMISYPVEELSILKRDGNEFITEGKMTKYMDFSKGVIMPSEIYRLNLQQPLSAYTPVHVSDDGRIVFQSEYTKDVAYTFGSQATLLQQQRVGQPIVSYQWDKYGEHVTAMAINTTAGIWFQESFEDKPAWEKVCPYSYASDITRTGTVALKIQNDLASEAYLFSPYLNINNISARKYKYSCWVYSTNPSVELMLFMKPNTDDNPYAAGWQNSSVSSSEKNKWVYLEGEVNVPAEMKQIYLRIDNNGGGAVYFDDLRLYPADAQITSYTWSDKGLLTSQTDPNGQSTYYHYDSLDRLIEIEDDAGHVVKRYHYNYAY